MHTNPALDAKERLNPLSGVSAVMPDRRRAFCLT